MRRVWEHDGRANKVTLWKGSNRQPFKMPPGHRACLENDGLWRAVEMLWGLIQLMFYKIKGLGTALWGATLLSISVGPRHATSSPSLFGSAD